MSDFWPIYVLNHTNIDTIRRVFTDIPTVYFTMNALPYPSSAHPMPEQVHLENITQSVMASIRKSVKVNCTFLFQNWYNKLHQLRIYSQFRRENQIHRHQNKVCR